MSAERQINSSLAILVSFMKERVSANLVEAVGEGTLPGLDQNNIEQVVNIVNASLEQSFSTGYSQVYTTLKELKVLG